MPRPIAGYPVAVELCKMCGQAIPRDEDEVVVGGFPLHAACAEERAASLSDEPGAQSGLIGEAPVADRGASTG